jgi:hypothetical protein
MVGAILCSGLADFVDRCRNGAVDGAKTGQAVIAAHQGIPSHCSEKIRLQKVREGIFSEVA